ncbi:MAG TPA: 16S rRNA (cytosine(1402)-N(4))-methyltransferase RsmH [Gemmatimonadaceae bacterium]|nr:16S rRNA (cytosine(1402)-N(4))-methyltransferase RsmH [Gemmatimonadaceae bacterium]
MHGPVSASASFLTDFHAPVLVAEVAALLHDARLVLDCTLGGGGHAAALLEQGASVIGLDNDPAAVREASDRLAAYRGRGAFRAVQANFVEIDAVPDLAGTLFDGVLLDLGVSSHQFDDPARGFTFRPGAPLDMRMNPDDPVDGAAILNESDGHELTRIFREHADERRASRLAREIVRRRANRPFRTSDDLVGAIRAVLGPRSGPAEFAPLFQAVRIAVNDELAVLERALPVLRDRLHTRGVIAVISYHSGEDRIVKHAFRDWSAACTCPPRQPVCTCRGRSLGATLTKRAITASADEVTRNPRARSARLRAWRSDA